MRHLTKLTAALALAGAFATSAIAAPVTYAVDSGHSFPNFSYQHMGLSMQLSKFDKTTGTITLDQAAKTASVDVVIDTTSVNTGSTVFNGHIQGEDFFDTAKYPTATFKSTKVVFEGDQPSTIEGDLTIKGITKPVTLKVTHFATKLHPMMKKEAVGANATTVIKRSDFNLSKHVPNVGDEVTITVSLEAVAK